MKKTHKKIFGLFGLVLVVAVTIFAAFLPGPKTQAAENSVTDEIRVRVVGPTAAIDLSGITSGGSVTSANQTIKVDYENIEKLLVAIKFTDANNIQYEAEPLLNNVPVDYITGISNVQLDLLNGTYSYTYEIYDHEQGKNVEVPGGGTFVHHGYGQYTIVASGYDLGGVLTDRSLGFSFLPVVANITQDGDNVTIGLDYDADDGTGTGTGEVARIVVNIYDEKGNSLKPSPIEVIPPTDSLKINLADYGFPSGTYTVSVQAYDKGGNKLYKAFEKKISYGAKSTGTPNTGGIMGDLNISRTDYIITGLAIFSVVGISGAVFISRHDKKANSRKRR